MRRAWLRIALLFGASPTDAFSQQLPESESPRAAEECRQLALRFRLGFTRQNSVELLGLSLCDATAGELLPRLWTEAPGDSSMLQHLSQASGVIRDRRILLATLDVARDSLRPPVLRAAALLAASSQFIPSNEVVIRRYGGELFALRLNTSHSYQLQGSVPVRSADRDSLGALAGAMRSHPAHPVRFAAEAVISGLNVLAPLSVARPAESQSHPCVTRLDLAKVVAFKIRQIASHPGQEDTRGLMSLGLLAEREISLITDARVCERAARVLDQRAFSDVPLRQKGLVLVAAGDRFIAIDVASDIGKSIGATLDSRFRVIGQRYLF